MVPLLIFVNKLDLLIRFYDVVEGSINIDNINVKKINLSHAEHAEILGYDAILDYIQLESYDEKEALICGLLTKDTSANILIFKFFRTNFYQLYNSPNSWSILDLVIPSTC
ncbi:hypothetical protein N9K77_00530 [bacterium]|nr:hypothetical protein [bacterium]